MLKHGADVAYSRQNGAHPLYIACKEGHESCARALVAAGADPNQVKEWRRWEKQAQTEAPEMGAKQGTQAEPEGHPPPAHGVRGVHL